MASLAVDLTRASRVVGYQLNAADFSPTAPNLPQRIVVIGEANTDKQTGLNTGQVQITSAQQAGELYGFGSPLHMASRILKPKYGDGVGGIPVICIAQEEAGSATEYEFELTVTGTPTANVTHFVNVAGRTSIDGESYAVSITTTDTVSTIATKIATALTAVAACPVKVVSTAAGVITIATKWKGLTAASVTVSMETGDNAAGMTYAVGLPTTAASGTPSITPALDTFGEQWNTLIVNTYGTETTVVAALEAFNGIPSNTNPTGQFSPIVQRPFVALTGSIEDEDTTFTDSKKDEVTIAMCPAPQSPGHPLEAAANMCVLYAPIAQNTPHLDVNGLSYPDMPVPSDGYIGTMSSYDNRDLYVKKGNSTVTYQSGAYVVQDFITTYHPDGEIIPQHRYVRNRTVDSNIRYGYHLREEVTVMDKVIANDDDVVNVTGVIKPREWKSEIFDYIDNLVLRGLIADSAFSKASVIVNLSAVNPERFESTWKYKRTGLARVLPTTVEAGFNFGTL